MLLDAKTRLVTLLGHPVEHSLSPAIHNAAFQEQGLNYAYTAADVPPERLASAVEGLRALDYAGANVTIPHKEAVRSYLDEETERAAAVGAVNTILCTPDGRLRGDNTDVAGFLEPLTPHADRLRGAEALLFGAGGAARAAVYALLTTFAPARCTLAVRAPERARPLVRDLAACDPDGALEITSIAQAGPAVRESRLIVNATPVGMHPETDATPWPEAENFSEGQLVYDLVYNPAETRLLREAAARGATPIGGLAMLVGQAAAAYRQWTGQEMPRAAARQALGEFGF